MAKKTNKPHAGGTGKAVDVPRLRAWIAEMKERYPDNPPPIMADDPTTHMDIRRSLSGHEPRNLTERFIAAWVEFSLGRAFATAVKEWKLPPSSARELTAWEYQELERDHASQEHESPTDEGAILHAILSTPGWEKLKPVRLQDRVSKALGRSARVPRSTFWRALTKARATRNPN